MSKKLYWADSLTGGGAGALDSINADNVLDGDLCQVFMEAEEQLSVYELDASTSPPLVDNPPDVITPDSELAKSPEGEKRWVLKYNISASASSNYNVTAKVEAGNIAVGRTITGTSLQNFADELLLNLTLSLTASVAGGVREFGNDITGVDLNATPNKGKEEITSLTISTTRDGTVATQSPIIPAGAALIYNTLCADYGNITNDMTITAQVTDGVFTITETTVYDFVFPFYAGWTDDPSDIFTGITRTQLLALDDISVLVKVKSTTNESCSPVNGRFVLGYPASYGNLSSIIDKNGFETISDYTIYTYNVVGLDGTTQSYKFYISSGDTTQTNFTNSFRF